MSRAGDGAIATLVRWREFEEARASSAFQQSRAKLRRVEERVSHATDSVDQAQRQLSTLLEASTLDLSLLQAASQIEQERWADLQDLEAERASAGQQQDAAQVQHVAARAQTRVAQTRRERLAAVLQNREEKLEFDWTADLYAQSRRGQR
jgi:hypothetical protein